MLHTACPICCALSSLLSKLQCCVGSEFADMTHAELASVMSKRGHKQTQLMTSGAGAILSDPYVHTYEDTVPSTAHVCRKRKERDTDGQTRGVVDVEWAPIRCHCESRSHVVTVHVTVHDQSKCTRTYRGTVSLVSYYARTYGQRSQTNDVVGSADTLLRSLRTQVCPGSGPLIIHG